MSVEKKIILSQFGIGGPSCPCCSDRPGSYARRKSFRNGRRLAKKAAIKEGMEG